MKYLLDSNVLIHAVKDLGGVRDRLQKQPPGDLGTSVVTLAELLYGTYKSSAPELARQKWLKALQPFTLLGFTEPCAHHHARLRYELRQHPIGERDLLIATIALSHDLILVTHNTTEFQRVPGLRWEDWYSGFT